MAITTTIAPSYGWRMLFVALLCLAFAVWGGYDYFIKIPRQNQVHSEYESLKSDLQRLEERRAQHARMGTLPSAEDVAEYNRIATALNAIAPGGAAPAKPGKLDSLTCWFFMACLPFAPWFFWLYLRAKRQVYQLDDDGTLHFSGDAAAGSGAWRAAQIADIDMSRWMAKSIAHAVHSDGKRLKLDAYLHRNLHLIIGAIASRLHPDQWDADAKPVKRPTDAEAPAEAEGLKS
jgi:hypothetical protein